MSVKEEAERRCEPKIACSARSLLLITLFQYTLARDVMKNAITHAPRIKEMAPP
jgi:hypothetical protein